MKLIVPFALCIAVGLIVATGCVTTTTKHAENTTTTISYYSNGHYAGYWGK